MFCSKCYLFVVIVVISGHNIYDNSVAELTTFTIGLDFMASVRTTNSWKSKLKHNLLFLFYISLKTTEWITWSTSPYLWAAYLRSAFKTLTLQSVCFWIWFKIQIILNIISFYIKSRNPLKRYSKLYFIRIECKKDSIQCWVCARVSLPMNIFKLVLIGTVCARVCHKDAQWPTLTSVVQHRWHHCQQLDES